MLAVIVAGCGSAGGRAAADGALSVELTTLDGENTVTLGEQAELPRVVNLWAQWCAPCRRELPTLDAVAAEADGLVEVIGVNIGDDPPEAARIVDELGLGFTQLLDRGGDLTAELGVVTMPSTVFVGADGAIAEVHAGELTSDELRSLIAEHLGVDLP